MILGKPPYKKTEFLRVRTAQEYLSVIVGFLCGKIFIYQIVGKEK
jgi:hypothetical protein